MSLNFQKQKFKIKFLKKSVEMHENNIALKYKLSWFQDFS
jgi:hypothetical protein